MSASYVFTGLPLKEDLMLTKPESSTTITLWNGREIPRL
ncbi:aldo/keto reductase, partial [Rhizobium johnstonii]